MGLLAFPAMLRAGYNIKISAGRDHRRRLPRHPDPAVGAADRLRRDRGRVGRAALRRRILPRLHARGRSTSATSSSSRSSSRSLMPPLPAERAGGAAAAVRASRWRSSGAQRADRARARRSAAAAPASRSAPSLAPALRHAAAGALHRRACWSSRYRVATAPVIEASTAGLVEAGGAIAAPTSRRSRPASSAQPDGGSGTGLAEPPAEEAKEGAPPAERGGAEGEGGEAAGAATAAGRNRPRRRRPPSTSGCRCPTWFWIVLAIGVGGARRASTALWNWERLEVFKFLLTSFFPLAILIIAVLGSIVFGLATPTEAAAVGAFGGFILAAAYRFIAHWRDARPAAQPGSAVATTVKELGTDREGVVVPHREDERDGVLALRRLVDLLRGVRAARRAGGHQRTGCCRST